MAENASSRAKLLDDRLEKQLDEVTLPASRKAIAQIRTYLHEQNTGLGNNVHRILKAVTSENIVSISVGPSFDKGPEDSHFYLESGSRLSFGITLRENNSRCSLVAYRFQLNVPENRFPLFYRFDLNAKGHDTPLLEPRCHLHPGLEEIRLPCPALMPLEVLDRIFLVIEPQLASG